MFVHLKRMFEVNHQLQRLLLNFTLEQKQEVTNQLQVEEEKDEIIPVKQIMLNPPSNPPNIQSTITMKHRLVKEDNVFKCPSCIKTYESLAGIKNHVHDKHSGSNSIKCPICDKIYKSISGFRNHRREIHSKK